MTTYFISDERMLNHKNEWDDHHIETPERLSSILKILRDNGVLSNCTKLDAKPVSLDDLRLVHSQKLIDEIHATQTLDKENAEKFSGTKEDIYINKDTYECALLAAGSAVHLTETVIKNPGSNGFAAVRPPGHHAWQDEPCGFCIFNNVAICAKKARQLGIERVLIFDWDIHAAQGTQYCIEDDPAIKLISIHRYEDGTFWPELAESAVRQPYKNTINVPLNEIGYGDAEYAAIFNSIVLPIVAEWKPNLILVSCGYDAAIGDPQGEMNVSPGGYAYMTGALASLNIPLVLLLEGGYYIHSVAQGALYTMNALIKRNQLELNLGIANPSQKFMRFLEFVIDNHSSQFRIFSAWQAILKQYRVENDLPEIATIVEEFKGKKKIPIPYPTRGLYEPWTKLETDKFDKIIADKIIYYVSPVPQKPSLPVEYDATTKKVHIGNAVIDLKTETDYYVVLFYILIPLSLSHKLAVTHSVKGPLSIDNGLLNVDEFIANMRIDLPDGNTDKNVSDNIASILNSCDSIRKYFAI